MSKYKYSTTQQDDCARAVGRSLPISTKSSIEVLSMIRGKQVNTAVAMLEEVQKLRKPVPYLRAYKDIGHRKGDLTSGRFPEKAAGHIKSIVLSAKANAEDRGLNVKELVLVHASAQQGGKVMRGGRHGRSAKRTHIEIMVKVVRQEKKPARTKTVKKTVEAKVKTPKPVVEAQPIKEEIKPEITKPTESKSQNENKQEAEQ